MLGLIMGPDPDEAARDIIAKRTVEDYDAHYTPGLVRYRKAVTEAGDFAAIEWTGEGTTVRDLHGREWIDCLGGYGIYNLGIRHPEVIAAVTAQLQRNPLPTQELLDPVRAMLCRLLADIAPGDISNAFVCNSGTEAMEGAMKVARVASGRKGFVCAEAAFHGKTLGALVADGQAAVPRAGRAAARRHPSRPVRRRRSGRVGARVPRRRDRRRRDGADPRRSRRGRPVRTSTGRPCASSATATTCCSSPTRCRPASDARGRCGPSITGGSYPTSSPSRNRSAVGSCRSARSWDARTCGNRSRRTRSSTHRPSAGTRSRVRHPSRRSTSPSASACGRKPRNRANVSWPGFASFACGTRRSSWTSAVAVC